MKTIVVQVVILIVIIGGYGIYKVGMSPKSLATDYGLLFETEQATRYFALAKRQENKSYIKNIQKAEGFKNDKEVESKSTTAKAKGIDAMAGKITEEIKMLRQDAISATGGENPANQVWVGYDKVVELDKNRIMQFVLALENYQQSLEENTGIEKGMLYAPDGKQVKPAAFANHYFVGKSLTVFLLNLARIENDIATYELLALEQLGKTANYAKWEVNELVPIIITEKDMVEEGGVYRAQIKIVGKVAGKDPVMFAEGQSIKVENGVGTIALPVKPPFKREKAGLSSKTWTGKVVVDGPGGILTYNVEDKYFVKKN